jgi:uncharacterized protein
MVDWGPNYPVHTLAVAITLSVAGGLIGSNLDISTSRKAMVNESEPHWKRYARFSEEFGVPEDLVIVLKGSDSKHVRATSEEIAQALWKYPKKIDSIFHRVDLAAFKDRAPLYLGYEQIHVLTQLAAMPALAKLRAEPAAAGRLAAINELLEAAPKMWTGSGLPSDFAPMSALVQSLFGTLEKYALGEKEENPPEIEAIDASVLSEVAGNPLEGSGLDRFGFLTADKGLTAIIFVRPAFRGDSVELLTPFVKLVRRTCEHVVGSKTNISFGLTGLPATEVDEHKAMTSDTAKTTTIAVLGVLILFLCFFPNIRLLGIALAPIVVGVSCTAGFAYLIYGYLNLLSSFFLVILIGMGIDFSIHILSRSVENQQAGQKTKEAVSEAILTSGRGILTGGLTSSGAFAAVGFSRFQAMAEMGVVACFGLLITMLASLLVLPALMVLVNPKPPQFQPGIGFMRFIGSGLIRFRYPALIIAVMITVFMGRAMQNIRFDYSLLNLLPAEAESSRLMAEMLDKRELSANAVVSVTTDLESARTLEKSLGVLPSVYRVASAASFLPINQENRIAQLKTTMQNLGKEKVKWQTRQDRSDHDLSAELDRILAMLEKLQDVAFRRGDPTSVAHFEASIESLANTIDGLAGDRGPAVRARIDAYTAMLLVYLEDGIKNVETTIKNGPLTADALPKGVRERFISKSGLFAVYAFPKKPMWDRENLEVFIQETSSVAKHLTGFPETYWHNTGMIYDGFKQAAFYAAMAVILLLLLDLKSFRYVFLGILPLGFGSIWMLGLMDVRGIDYNLANIFALPLIIGVGIDNAVHLLHRYRQDKDLDTAFKHTGGAIILSSATTMIGFGSLHFASHQGMKSLGEILFLGVGCCLFSALMTLPAIVRFLPETKT